MSDLVLHGLDDDDKFTVAGNHPFFKGIALHGGNPSASDLLTFNGSGGGDVAVNFNAPVNTTIQEAGGGTSP